MAKDGKIQEPGYGGSGRPFDEEPGSSERSSWGMEWWKMNRQGDQNGAWSEAS